ncbi:hypothetical protein LX36DRAFT_148344 [Colletotrichum falcatum]|nr:hypothetical protein LX36DRAFT_148344 [Colletotrichum falcatum]
MLDVPCPPPESLARPVMDSRALLYQSVSLSVLNLVSSQKREQISSAGGPLSYLLSKLLVDLRPLVASPAIPWTGRFRLFLIGLLTESRRICSHGHKDLLCTCSLSPSPSLLSGSSGVDARSTHRGASSTSQASATPSSFLPLGSSLFLRTWTRHNSTRLDSTHAKCHFSLLGSACVRPACTPLHCTYGYAYASYLPR